MGRNIAALDSLPDPIYIASAIITAGIALLTLMPAMTEIAKMGYNPRYLLVTGMLLLALFLLTAVISRAAYNNYEGLLAFNTFFLLGMAACFGLWLSAEIEKFGHLLPVCIIAAGVDILSVAKGPSSVVVKQIDEHLQYIAAGIAHAPPLASFLILRYPQAGSGLAMMIGVGDLAFFAILAGIIVKMKLPRINILLTALFGFMAVLTSHLLQMAVPALPFIGIGFVLANVKRIHLDRTEWQITFGLTLALIVIGVILALKPG
mgnify:CR=1 FL=1